jgi:DnaJ-domain-containing protein 1
MHTVQVLTQQHKAALMAVQQEADRQIVSVEGQAEQAAQDATAACQQLCDK